MEIGVLFDFKNRWHLDKEMTPEELGRQSAIKAIKKAEDVLTKKEMAP